MREREGGWSVVESMKNQHYEDFLPEDVENLEEPEPGFAMTGLGLWMALVISYAVLLKLGLISGL
ncbi:hypothetical protein CHM34_02660 [Paludifilum halophilum]|uniref:Uncharacterized protein n=1 Tax=Paludifilum halophilum TaxID=1642702 RepID=A0A235BE68_9BACL|nr:hypothetical protein CHM34_02660 [Paludifilum halophilum]